MENNIGQKMYSWAKDLFPIDRSLTGAGVRETLNYFKNLIPELEVKSVPTGYQAFDWTVPEEWVIKDAYIQNKAGEKLIDFKENNLHVLGYSEPVDKWVDLEELDKHLYSLPEQPEAIPYVTSYYKKRWGFCLSHDQRQKLVPGEYRVVVDSQFKEGVLNYAEIIIPGKSGKEVFLSSYVCHPSMANNELSGPVVTMALAQWIKTIEKRKYTYRIVLIPETIGSIVYISQNLEELKKNIIAGFNVTCIGDERCFSFLPSREGNTLSDRVALHVLNGIAPDFKRYTWLDRGSDERQYCAPGVDLPMASIMRSKYGEYPEYHTSLDNLNLISPEGLEGGYNALKKAIEIIERDKILKSTVLCEPQLGKRGLYPTVSVKGSANEVRKMMNLISYCDGKHSTLDIAERINVPVWELYSIVDKLTENKVIRIIR
jgi:aminopeptidase-like protein